jgi:RNA polymerase sigma-70 factor (ECF subfamily)
VRSEDEAKAVDRFIDSFQQGDLEGVIAALSDDAKFVMPPEPFEFRGPRVIAEYFHSRGVWGQDLRFVPTRANNQPAFGYYLRDPNANVHRVRGIMVLTVRADQVSVITRFGDRSLLALFGLPRVVSSVQQPPGERQRSGL